MPLTAGGVWKREGIRANPPRETGSVYNDLRNAIGSSFFHWGRRAKRSRDLLPAGHDPGLRRPGSRRGRREAAICMRPPQSGAVRLSLPVARF